MGSRAYGVAVARPLALDGVCVPAVPQGPTLRFQRLTGEVVQVIDFQLSQANFADTGEFFVNVALGIGRLWELEGGPRPDRPKVYECQVRKRLEEVVPGPPPAGTCRPRPTSTPWRGDCRTRSASLLGDLDGITSVEALLGTGWLAVGADLIARGPLRYVGGDHDAALADLRAASEFFSDRRGMSLGELIRRHGMSELRRLGDTG